MAVWAGWGMGFLVKYHNGCSRPGGEKIKEQKSKCKITQQNAKMKFV